MRRLAAALLLMTLPALALPVQSPSWIAGFWFGQGQPNDKSEMWIAHMGADGSFHAQFRACRKGKASDTTNDGNWRLNGDMETIQIQTVGGQYFPRTDYYAILSHDGKSQSYRYLATGFVYTSKRVDAKFQMPACDLVS
jgi:hypothetical protein